jgi:succinyl-diaminopimelate desuccinylase
MTEGIDAAGLLRDLVNIESVTGNEKAIMGELGRMLSGVGACLSRYDMGDGRYNLLASVGEGLPVLCLNAHSDTMPPSGRSVPRASEEGGLVRGLGSCDDKASLTAMIICLSRLRSMPLRGRLDLLISVDEEVSSRGVRTCVEGGYRCDYAIVGEPTNLNPVTAHSGIIFFDLETKGVGGHGSTPWGGKSAIREMVALWEEVDQLVSTLPSHPLVGRPSTNLGVIRGGDSTNRIPTECSAKLDVRVMPGMSVSSAIDRISALAGRRGAGCSVYKRGDPFESKTDSALLELVREAQGRVLGEGRDPIGFRGWTEADPLRNVAGADALVLGPGRVEVAHTEDEYVEVSQVLEAADIYTYVAKKLLVADA